MNHNIYSNACQQESLGKQSVDYHQAIIGGSVCSTGERLYGGGRGGGGKSARKSSSKQALEAAYSQEEFERQRAAIMRAGYHQFFETIGPSLIPLFAQLQGQISEFMALQGFWEFDTTAEKIALMHSELSEALEADRKGIEHDDKIPDFTGVEAELADTIIRIFDFAGYHQLRLAEALVAKMHVNLERPFKHGKAY